MPSRGSALAVAVASTTLSPMRTSADPWACLANFPVSKESCLPPARSTVTELGSGFIMFSFDRSFEPRAASRERAGAGDPGMDRLVGCAPMMHGAEGSFRCCAGFQREGGGQEMDLKSSSGAEALVHSAGSRMPDSLAGSRIYLRMPSLPITVL